MTIIDQAAEANRNYAKLYNPMLGKRPTPKIGFWQTQCPSEARETRIHAGDNCVIRYAARARLGQCALGRPSSFATPSGRQSMSR